MRLAEALRRAVGDAEEPTRSGRARSLPDVEATFGGRHGLISWLAGTERRSSREYRSAARRLQRYAQGTRRPSGEFMRKVRAGASRRASRTREEQRRRRLPQFGDGVYVFGKITVSRDTRRRGINGRFDADEWDDIIDALDRGDEEDAEELFADAFGRANHFAATPEWEDVEVLRPAL